MGIMDMILIKSQNSESENCAIIRWEILTERVEAMERRKRAVLICLMGILGVFSWLWLRSQQVTSEPVEEVLFEELEPLDATAQLIHGDDPAFSASIEDFIRCFNGVFGQATGEAYFPDVSRWNCSSVQKGIHSPYPARQFRFFEDESVYSLPTVTVYTPMEERCIQEITINFDEHSYTEAGFRRFRRLCVCAIRTFIPGMQEKAAEELCDEILGLGSQNIFESSAWFGNGAVPSAIYYQDGIGIYPYDAIGDWRRFCIIPVTQARLKEFEQEGAVLHEME